MKREVFLVVSPGPMTTVQDQGRFGFAKYGVPVSGALDTFAYAAANWLVGNDDSAATLEMTYIGPKLEVLCDCLVAVTGARMSFRVNGVEKPLWSTVRVRYGDMINIGPALKGLRSYLGVSGGICVEKVMGSRSTFAGARLGGYRGRALERGDRLEANESAIDMHPLMLSPELWPKLENKVTLRSISGPQEDYFRNADTTFFSSEYVCGPKADRMGIRLDGPRICFRDENRTTIISEPHLTGCVQVPPEGKPIILLVEQTVGGYAKIASVITADLDLLAQLKPGDSVNFEKVCLEEAHEALMAYRKKIHSIDTCMT